MSIKNVLNYLPQSVSAALLETEQNILDSVSEIRLYRGGAVVTAVRNTAYLLCEKGVLSLPDMLKGKTLTVSKSDFDNCFLKLCSFSVYSKTEEICGGYISLDGGVRVGLSGSAVYEKERLISVRDVTSLNFRIPRAVDGFGLKLLKNCFVSDFKSVIIAGPPNSGKTTLLRDIAYQLSSGYNSRLTKVCIIDERNEIAPCSSLEYSCDVLSSFTKEKGLEIAVRSLSPEVVVLDEIATPSEAEKILFAFKSGVSFALSVHAGNKDELFSRSVSRFLIESGEFSHAAILNSYTYDYEIIRLGE